MEGTRKRGTAPNGVSMMGFVGERRTDFFGLPACVCIGGGSGGVGCRDGAGGVGERACGGGESTYLLAALETGMRTIGFVLVAGILYEG